MFRKVLNWNYILLMSSASPYTQCLIAPGWWDSLSPGHFLHWDEQACHDDTLFSAGLFLYLPCPKAGWEVRQWLILCSLAFKSAWSFSKEAVFVSLRVVLHHFLEFQIVFILLHGTAPQRAESHQIFPDRLCFPSFMVRAGLSPS